MKLAVVLALIATTTDAAPCLAQQVGVPRTATVRVRVVDSATGRPIGRAGLGATGWTGLAFTDTTGGFTLYRVPVGSELRVRCPTTRRLVGPLIRRLVLQVDGPDTSIVFRLSATECIEPPIQSTHGEFRGHFTSGFESSDFLPCDGVPATAKAVGDSWGKAWVSFSKRVDLSKVKWPKVPDASGYPTVYVRWEGTMTGPGGYGHMGVAAFAFEVDRIVEIRAPRADDCR